MSEPPFVPRERILKYQQYFQSLHKHTYLKGRYDMVTSVAIPLTLAASSLFFIVSPFSRFLFFLKKILIPVWVSSVYDYIV